VVSAEKAISMIEEWDWQERQSKYMLQNYYAECYGYDWWFPLWDRAYIAFWRSLPASTRLNKSLYKQYVDRTLGVDIKTPTSLIGYIKSRIKNTPILDPTARRLYYNVTDPAGYNSHPGNGMMSKSQFDELQSENQGIHVFRALDLMNRIDVFPPENRYPPIDGVIYPRSHYQ